MDERQFTVKEVAEHFRVSRQSIYDWINDGRLKAIKVGERIRIPQSALDSFIRPVQPGEAIPDNSD